MRVCLVTLILLAGCAGAQTAASSRPLAVLAGDCYNPVDYGAIPDDSIDDRAAFQAAIDAVPSKGGTVCIGTGRWRIDHAPITARNRFAGISVHNEHVTITGAGPATILSLEGDQGGISLLGLIAVDPGALDIDITDLSIDTTLATNTSEQTHAIQVGSGIGLGDIADIRIDRVRFDHPLPAAPGRSGDCIRLLGNPSGPAVVVRRVTVVGSTFGVCARSSISYQRNVIGLVVAGNTFIAVGDQAIDGEPSGSGLDGSIAITGNLFDEDTHSLLYQQGDYAISIAGLPSLVSRVSITGNVFSGRGIVTALATDVSITGNVFDAEMEGVAGVVDVRSTADRMLIADNIIRRRGSVGALVRVQHSSLSQSASQFAIRGNVLENGTAGNGIDVESARDLMIDGNSITWAFAAPAAIGIRLRSVAQPANGVLVHSNRIDGTIAVGVYLAAVSLPIRGVSVVGNVVRGAALGLQCLGLATAWPEPIVHASNRWPSLPSCPQAVLVGNIP